MNRRCGGRNAGFTLMEVLTAVAVTALLAVIAIPSVIQIRGFLAFQNNERTARSCFLAVQENLLEHYSRGSLEDWGSPAIPQVRDPEGTPPEGCLYLSGDDPEGALLLGPMGVQILGTGGAIVEYDPWTGNVYSVFYHPNGAELRKNYEEGTLPREKSQRKAMQLGYYDGGSLGRELWKAEPVETALRIHNGQECTATVVIPVMGTDILRFVEGLRITVTLTGETQGTVRKELPELVLDRNCTLGQTDGGIRAVCVVVTLDSLWEGGSFAQLSAGIPPEQAVSEEVFSVLPGDNVTVRADVTYRNGPGEPYLRFESSVVSGVNPLFASLTENRSGRYVVEIANGRHLQNLNAVAPAIANRVDTVIFRTEDGIRDPAGKVTGGDLDWQETADYYGGLAFVPIRNPWLFGGIQRDSQPQAEQSLRSRYAQVLGNGVKIRNLQVTEASCAASYPGYTGLTERNRCLAGLFGEVNCKIGKLYMVNPVIRGGKGQGLSAAGSLVGAAGPDTRLSGCGAYIDTAAADYRPQSLDMQQFTGGAGMYGVSGYDAVGGLVGLFRGENPGTDTITNSYAAVPVYGVTRTAEKGGSMQGVGGLVGNARLIRIRKCYASGVVTAEGCRWEPGNFAVTEFCADAGGSWGAGGFVGTEQGCYFDNCFASGNVRSRVAGGFVGVMCYDAGEFHSEFRRCYSLGVSCGEDQLLENFSGVQALTTDCVAEDFLWDYYQAAIPAYLETGSMEPEGYVYRDCCYLSGNAPNADYGGPELCAKPMSYEMLKNLPRNSAQALQDLKAAALPSEAALESAKTCLRALAADETAVEGVLANYWGRGSTRIYFDALPYLDSPQDLARRLTSRYGNAFPGSTWGAAGRTFCYEGKPEENFPFPMLTGMPYYGNWPEKQEIPGDFGILYYERYETSAGVRMVSLSGGHVRVLGLDPSCAATETGYALYFPEQTKPFSRDTYALQGPDLTGLHQAAGLPETFRICEIPLGALRDANGDPASVTVSSRDGKRSVNFVPGFADSIGQSTKTFRIRSQAQLEQLEQFPNGSFVLSGQVRLDESFQAIPFFGGSLTGEADSCLVVPDGSCGLVKDLEGTLEKITVQGTFSLQGVAGILCNRLGENGIIRDCRVTAEILPTDAEAVGGVVGILEGGTLIRTQSRICVDGEDLAGVGLVLGAGRTGVLEECHGQAETPGLPFAGEVAVLQSQSVPYATHTGQLLLEEGLITAEIASELSDRVPDKKTYGVEFRNCTMTKEGWTHPFPEVLHYYRLTPVGGWKVTACRELPESGSCILVTEQGKILHCRADVIQQSAWDGSAELRQDWFWNAGGALWQGWESDRTVTLEVLGTEQNWDEELWVLAVYEEPVTWEVTRIAPDGTRTTQTQTRMQRQQVRCRVYAVTENTDSRLLRLDSGSVLEDGGK